MGAGRLRTTAGRRPYEEQCRASVTLTLFCSYFSSSYLGVILVKSNGAVCVRRQVSNEEERLATFKCHMDKETFVNEEHFAAWRVK